MCAKVQVVCARACACVCVSTRRHQTGHQEISPDAVFSSHILFGAKISKPNEEPGIEMNTMCLNMSDVSVCEI